MTLPFIPLFQRVTVLSFVATAAALVLDANAARPSFVFSMETYSMVFSLALPNISFADFIFALYLSAPSFSFHFARTGPVLVPCWRRAWRTRPTVSPLGNRTQKESLSSCSARGCRNCLMETQREASASALPLQGVVHLKLPTFLAATRHSLALGLARSIREPRLRGGYATSPAMR